METKELRITIPENCKIDWQESAKQEKIVFKKIDNTKPRSWEKYCEQQIVNKKHGYYTDDKNCNLVTIIWREMTDTDKWRNVLPSEELAEAFLAMMQLMSLRQAWIGDWKPDWNDTNWCIKFRENKLEVDFYNYTAQPLSFPTEEMATDFMNCFGDLLEIAKPLI